ncbi:uncharacterized protein LOC143230987 [Tachypleus tridentatus]|uniref:uncharacterized protein LOC143230987 n=1 Tax=Tachypleus tridentatus TaxID=6853 RepID=UPI003FD6B719
MRVPSNLVVQENRISMFRRQRSSKAVTTYRELVKKKVLKRVHGKLQRIQEYRQLRSMVPSIAQKPHVPKVTVIAEAIRYIKQLHNALLTRLRTRGLPSCLQGLNIDLNNFGHSQIKDLVRHVMVNYNTYSEVHVSLSGSTCENTRSVPSYLLQKGKNM